jgi:hypothetical protein
MHDAAGLGSWKLDGTSVLLLESCTMKFTPPFSTIQASGVVDRICPRTDGGRRGRLLATLLSMVLPFLA